MPFSACFLAHLSKLGSGLPRWEQAITAAQEVLDGRQVRPDALVVGDGAGGLVLGDVEVAAEQDLLALDVHVLDCFFVVVHSCCCSSFQTI